MKITKRKATKLVNNIMSTPNTHIDYISALEIVECINSCIIEDEI